jgi:hypothetical protein
MGEIFDAQVGKHIPFACFGSAMLSQPIALDSRQGIMAIRVFLRQKRRLEQTLFL